MDDVDHGDMDDRRELERRIDELVDELVDAGLLTDQDAAFVLGDDPEA